MEAAKSLEMVTAPRNWSTKEAAASSTISKPLPQPCWDGQDGEAPMIRTMLHCYDPDLQAGVLVLPSDTHEVGTLAKTVTEEPGTSWTLLRKEKSSNHRSMISASCLFPNFTKVHWSGQT